MKVCIYAEQKSTPQSGRARIGRVQVEIMETGRREPEPLMGWTGAVDTLNQIRITFDSMESAIRYVEKQKWDYTALADAPRRIQPRNYTDAFRYNPPEDAV